MFYDNGDDVSSIVSKKLFTLTMDRLEKNKYAPSSYKADERYLLSTKLICGCCGATMVGESGTGRKADIEEAVMQKTVSYVFDKDIMDGIVSRVLQWQERENTTLPLLQRELADVEKSLSNVMAAIEQGIINPTTKKRMDELTEQKTDLEVKIASEKIQEQILTKEQIEFWLSKMVSLDLASRDNKQRIVDTFVNSIYVYDDKAVINFNCREESETIPLKLSTYVSDLRGLGEPRTLDTACRAAKWTLQALLSIKMLSSIG